MRFNLFFNWPDPEGRKVGIINPQWIIYNEMYGEDLTFVLAPEKKMMP